MAWYGGLKKQEYINLHNWIRYNYGGATKCENKDCKYPNPKRFEWSLRVGRTYSKDIDDYIQLCPSCHRKQDETDERRKKLSIKNKGRHFHGRDRPVRKMLPDGGSVRYDSISIAARENGFKSNHGISRCVKGFYKESGGFKWEYA